MGQVIPPDSTQGITEETDTLVVTTDSIPNGKQNFKGTTMQPVVERKTAHVKEAENDSVVIPRRHGKDHYDPKIAMRRSLILPGWGQLYNNRWWKVPIVYAGFGVFAVLIIKNNQGYMEYDRAVKCKGDTSCVNDPFPGYSIDNIISVRESYRRYRDLNFILTGLWYTLNVVDAYVDAHLRDFNVSDDLSLDVHPRVWIDPFRQNSLYTGVTLSLKLRQ